VQAEKVMQGAAGEDEESGGQPGIDLPFGGEVGLGVASQAYWWHNKYAPRKPKYFNRCVRPGCVWLVSACRYCVLLRGCRDVRKGDC